MFTKLRILTDVFALNDSELGGTDIVSHNIDTGNKLPVKQPPYREKIAELVMEIQERGIMQLSTSPWASPVVLVQTKMDPYDSVLILGS